eukprot:TRINITY_DN45692_c0_g1_i1.p1 TRINITY_DN45692_c0_g1~~TRINITY_DN45692_c0_g1_i1.p1  ORF type:complete len:672 (+),score=155.00 TRINITY_DN45692_c0_g1_i1:122-2137(+)
MVVVHLALFAQQAVATSPSFEDEGHVALSIGAVIVTVAAVVLGLLLWKTSGDRSVDAAFELDLNEPIKGTARSTKAMIKTQAKVQAQAKAQTQAKAQAPALEQTQAASPVEIAAPKLKKKKKKPKRKPQGGEEDDNDKDQDSDDEIGEGQDVVPAAAKTEMGPDEEPGEVGWTEITKRKPSASIGDADAVEAREAHRRSNEIMVLRRRKAVICQRLGRMEEGLGVSAVQGRRDDQERRRLDARAQLQHELDRLNWLIQECQDEELTVDAADVADVGDVVDAVDAAEDDAFDVAEFPAAASGDWWESEIPAANDGWWASDASWQSQSGSPWWPGHGGNFRGSSKGGKAQGKGKVRGSRGRGGNSDYGGNWVSLSPWRQEDASVWAWNEGSTVADDVGAATWHCDGGDGGGTTSNRSRRPTRSERKYQLKKERQFGTKAVSGRIGDDVHADVGSWSAEEADDASPRGDQWHTRDHDGRVEGEPLADEETRVTPEKSTAVAVDAPLVAPPSPADAPVAPVSAQVVHGNGGSVGRCVFGAGFRNAPRPPARQNWCDAESSDEEESIIRRAPGVGVDTSATTCGTETRGAMPEIPTSSSAPLVARRTLADALASRRGGGSVAGCQAVGPTAVEWDQDLVAFLGADAQHNAAILKERLKYAPQWVVEKAQRFHRNDK